MAQAASSSAKKKTSSRSANGRAAASSPRKATSKKPAAAKTKSSPASRTKSTGQSTKETASGVVDKVRGPLSKVGGPVITGAATAAGLVGAAALGARLAGRRKRVLGVPIPGTGNGMARQVGKAGKQFGDLARELRATREKAAQVGKAIS